MHRAMSAALRAGARWRWRALSALAWAALALACERGESRISSYPVLIHALDDVGKPLPGMQLLAAGKELGVTDASGDRLLSLQGTEGQRVDLSAACPTGYDGPRERPYLLLKRVQSLQAPGLQPIELSLTCAAKEHVSLVAIRTGHAGIPVKLRGQTVAQTSVSGTTHVVLKESVGNQFQLTLDTSELADLRPESPTRIFSVGQRDAFAVWDQPFEEEKKPPAAPPKKKHKAKAKVVEAPPAPPPPPKHIPERLL
jgi:hypothetical protein